MIPPVPLSKEFFHYPASKPIFQRLEEVSQRSGVSRAVAWEDFLQCAVCALGHPLMEDEYLQTIEKHKQGTTGKRGVDKIAETFAALIQAMTDTDSDILGDIHEGAISRAEHQQFMTPEPVADAMARMTLPEADTGLEGRRTIADPACGSGRMLLAAAKLQPHWHFVGQDIDRRCVLMCSLNLALRNRFGHVVWGNTLTDETKLIYETGRLQLWGNVIRKVSRVPLPDREPEEVNVPATAMLTTEPMHAPSESESPSPAESPPRKQLKLF